MDADLVIALLGLLGVVVTQFVLNRNQVAQLRTQAEQERDRHQAELARVKADAEAAKRDDNREEIEALWAENRRLREEVATRNGAQDARIAQLEREIQVLRGERCPWGRADCPREHRAAPVVVGRKE